VGAGKEEGGGGRWVGSGHGRRPRLWVFKWGACVRQGGVRVEEERREGGEGGMGKRHSTYLLHGRRCCRRHAWVHGPRLYGFRRERVTTRKEEQKGDWAWRGRAECRRSYAGVCVELGG